MRRSSLSGVVKSVDEAAVRRAMDAYAGRPFKHLPVEAVTVLGSFAEGNWAPDSDVGRLRSPESLTEGGARPDPRAPVSISAKVTPSTPGAPDAGGYLTEVLVPSSEDPVLRNFLSSAHCGTTRSGGAAPSSSRPTGRCCPTRRRS